MTALIGTELLKLVLTRATWGFLAAALLLAALRVEMVLHSVGTVGAPARGSSELAISIVGASAAGLILVLLLGVVTVTAEYQHATLTPTLISTPNRRRVLAAKAVAAALVGAGLSVTLFGLAAARGLVAGVIEPRLSAPLLQLVLGGILGTAIWGWLGVAVGALVRNQTLALLLPVVWILVIETLLPSFGLARVVPWTPVGATSALGGAEFAGALPMWAAGALLVGYATLVSAPGVRRFLRSDVT